MTRRVPLVLVALACVIGACQLLLPERFAVNAPLLNSLFGIGVDAPEEDTIRNRIRVPDGFGVRLYAADLPNARNLRFAPNGDLLIARPRHGEVTLLEADRDGDGNPDGRRPLLEGLDRPYGLDFHDGWLYVGLSDGFGRIAFDPATSTVAGPFEQLVSGVPAGGNHWTRNIRVGPDELVYLTVGSSCNVCIEEDPRRAAMLRYEPDGNNETIYATGLRNAVDFDWQPGTGTLYATDNGRDLLGDDFPPCELNAIVEGGFYGWPFRNGDNVVDPDLGHVDDPRVADAIPPAHAFRAHNAPLGIHFVRGDQAPPLRDAALVALHGSWNRTEKDGYKVVSLHWNEDGSIDERDFLTGFLVDEDVIGRPAHVEEGPDGAFYVSDDYAGVIWRVAWGESSAATTPGAAMSRASAPLALDPRSVARGEALYEKHDCASCHEQERAAEGVVVKPLADLAARYDQAGLATSLVTPTPPMPVFELDAAERADLAAYLLSRFGRP